jgi:hypothetical protein
LGRFIGWTMVFVALVLASGDAVMALGATGYPGLATGEIVTLLVGENPEHSLAFAPSLLEAVAAAVFDAPAWLAVGVLGLALIQMFRPRRARRRRFTRL